MRRASRLHGQVLSHATTGASCSGETPGALKLASQPSVKTRHPDSDISLEMPDQTVTRDGLPPADSRTETPRTPLRLGPW